MEHGERSNTKHLIKSFSKDINKYSLDAMMRILESLVEDLEEQSIKLSSNARLDNPWCELSGIAASEDNDCINLTCNRFGIASLQSCLPNSYIEDFIISKNPALYEFLNIFNNKLLNLSYNTSKKYSLALQNKPFSRTNFAKILLALCGAFEIDDLYQILIKHSLLLWKKPRSLIGLQKILESFVLCDVKIDNLRGDWDVINQNSLTVLGKKNYVLGKDTISGKYIWNQNAKLLLTIGPLGIEDFYRCVQNGDILKTICFIMSKYLNFGKRFEIKIIVKQEDITPVRLSNKNYLGIDSWMQSRSGYSNVVSVSKQDIDRMLQIIINE